MSSILNRLASNLPDEAFKYTSDVFKDGKYKLMKQKGVYPYDYTDNINKFDEKLTGKIEFHSILQDEHRCDEQYIHA